MIQTPKHVVIVGGGIVGLSSAYALLQRGIQVTIIDRLPLGGDNCSRGNAGMIVPSHFIPLAAPGVIGQGIRWLRDPESPFFVKPRLSLRLLQWGLQFYLASTREHVDASAPLLRDLSLGSRELYVRWSESGIECSLAKRGLLMLCQEPHTLDEESKIAERARQLGIPAQVLSSTETSSLDPNVSMRIVGSIYYPKDCHLDPSLLLSSLRNRIESLGGTFLADHHVTGWRTHSQSIDAITTVDGEIEGDAFIVATGIWSEELVRSLRIRIPMQPGKGYSLTLPNPIELPSVCSILCEARVAVTPIGQSVRFGGTMELGEINQMIDPRRVHGILKSIPRYMPSFKRQHFDGIQPWVGLRPLSPDGLPYVGRPKRWNNLVVATGHAMMGLSLGPVTGELVAQLLADQPLSYRIEALSPDRFDRFQG